MSGTWKRVPDDATEGADSFNGIRAAETAFGLGGNDKLIGRPGDDLLDGGAGDDVIGELDTSNGEPTKGKRWNPGPDATDGRDSFDGIGAAETAFGLGGNDTLIGNQGDDLLDGGAGDDVIGAASTSNGWPTKGNDTLVGGAGSDTLRDEVGSNLFLGGNDNDSLYGGSGQNTFDGGSGNDTVTATGADTISVGDGNDFVASCGAATVDGGADNDTLTASSATAGNELRGGIGNDSLLGGNGADTLLGEDGADTLNGRLGNDSIDGGNDNDSVGAGAGNDLVLGGNGDDSLDGGGDNDTASYADASGGVAVNLTTGRATGAAGNDTLISFEGVIGSDHADTLTGGNAADTLLGGNDDDTIAGGAGADSLLGGEGADTLAGGNGADSIAGGAGDDIASYADASAGVAVDLVAGTATGGAGNDTLSNVEGAVGSGSEDTLTGGSGANTLIAGAGNDLVFDAGGNNSLDGGANTDRLTFTTTGFYDIVRGAGGELTITYQGNDTAAGPGIGQSTSTAVNFEEFSYNGGLFNLTAPGWDGTDTLQVCFAAGTRILTATGEVAVEQLHPGDRVVTLAGRGLPVKPVLWVGRRHVVLAGRADAAEMAPIRVKAGALGPNTPKRDLVVSPDHCLYLDGALVPARLLVNGRSVVAEIGMAEVTWYHVELETHEVLVAEGASAESWLDCGNRSWFENAPVALLTVPGNLDTLGTGWDATRACAPLVHGGERLAAIRASLDTRAEALAAPQPARMAR